jgi:hypothetical protein
MPLFDPTTGDYNAPLIPVWQTSPAGPLAAPSPPIVTGPGAPAGAYTPPDAPTPKIAAYKRMEEINIQA